MATSYSNTGGSGDRQSLIRVAHSIDFNGGMTGLKWIDGTTGSQQGWIPSGRTSGWIDFDFSAIGKRVIDAFRIYGSDTTSNGTWAVKAFNGSTWDTLLASFTFAAGANYATPNEITFDNSTAYDNYRLEMVSGTTSSSPGYAEIEFKIEESGFDSDTLWTNSDGSGDRRSTISVSSNITLGGYSGGSYGAGPNIVKLVDGTKDNSGWWFAAGQSDRYIEFTFGSDKIIEAFAWFQAGTSVQGNWRFLGWNGASWDELMAAAELNSWETARPGVYRFGCSVGYTLFRLEQTSGSTSSSQDQGEIEFKIADYVPSDTIEGYFSAREAVDTWVFAGDVKVTGDWFFIESEDIASFTAMTLQTGDLVAQEDEDVAVFFESSVTGDLEVQELEDTAAFSNRRKPVMFTVS